MNPIILKRFLIPLEYTKTSKFNYPDFIVESAFTPNEKTEQSQQCLMTGGDHTILFSYNGIFMLLASLFTSGRLLCFVKRKYLEFQVRPVRYCVALPTVFRLNRYRPHILKNNFPKELIIVGGRAFVAPNTVCSIPRRMTIPGYFPGPNSMAITAVLSKKTLVGIKMALRSQQFSI